MNDLRMRPRSRPTYTSVALPDLVRLCTSCICMLATRSYFFGGDLLYSPVLSQLLSGAAMVLRLSAFSTRG